MKKMLACTGFILFLCITTVLVGNSSSGETSAYGGATITIDNPRSGERIPIGGEYTIRWIHPAYCGNRVDIFAVRERTRQEVEIARNVSANTGVNSYRWNIRMPVYIDILGNFKIKVVSNGGCWANSNTFELVRPGTPVSSEGSDFYIDTVTFEDGRELNHGYNFGTGGDARGTFNVLVKWNRMPPPSQGSHYIECKSTLTRETIGGTNIPRRFSYRNAASDTGNISVNVPFTIPANRILAMKRDRFIPIDFRLIISNDSCDHNGRNNLKQVNMRALNIPVDNNLVIEIETGSVSCKYKKKSVGKNGLYFYDISFRVRVRNMSRNAAGGPMPALSNVKARWELQLNKVTGWDNYARHLDFTIKSVTNTWITTRVSGETATPPNWWRDVRLAVWIDPDREISDPDRDNNRANYVFRVPGR
jgi:hypothetical protein